jgi:hypothetical protein
MKRDKNLIRVFFGRLVKNYLLLMIFCMGIGFMFAIQSISVVPEIKNTPVYQKSWHLVGMADATIGAGVGGVLYTYIAKNATITYTSNITGTANLYVWGWNRTTLGYTVPWGQSFDVVVKVRWNATEAYNSTSHAWNLAWVRANITCPGLGLTNASMTEYNITGCTGKGIFIWVHYVYPNKTLTRNQKIEVCWMYFWAYY